jgi:hypothetical protein
VSNTKRRWFVHLEKSLYQHIKGQPSGIFDKYIDAVSAVNDIANTYSQYPIEICYNGFLIPVEGQNKALRCIAIGEKREIHITGIVEYQ